MASFHLRTALQMGRGRSPGNIVKTTSGSVDFDQNKGLRETLHYTWSMEHGAGSMEHGAGSMEHGAGSMEHGAWIAWLMHM